MGRSRSRSPGGHRRVGTRTHRPLDISAQTSRDTSARFGQEERRRSRSRDRDRERERDRDRERRRGTGYQEHARRSRSRSPPRRRSRSPRRRSRSPRRRRSRSQSRDQQPEVAKKSMLAERPSLTESDFEGKTEEEIEMMKLMGFGGFETTKGKPVAGNNHNHAANIINKRKYRQYMNRKGGFNRPLDFIA